MISGDSFSSNDGIDSSRISCSRSCNTRSSSRSNNSNKTFDLTCATLSMMWNPTPAYKQVLIWFTYRTSPDNFSAVGESPR